jgi:hypothetical protein
MIKTCNNCAYRQGEFGQFGTCLLTGNLCTTQRTLADSRCDLSFSGWVERPKTWYQKLWEHLTVDNHPNVD